MPINCFKQERGYVVFFIIHDTWIASKQIVDDTIIDVNDFAERAVKLTSDFSKAARGEDHFQNVLQAVCADRQAKPNLRRKKEAKGKKWTFKLTLN